MLLGVGGGWSQNNERKQKTKESSNIANNQKKILITKNKTTKSNNDRASDDKDRKAQKKNHRNIKIHTPQNINFNFQQGSLDESFFNIHKLPLMGIVIPGYDMFMLNRTGWASFYLGAKIATAVLMYATYKDYGFWRSAATSAAKVQAQDPDVVLFKDPNDTDKQLTLTVLQNRKESAFFNFLLSSIGQAVIFGINYLHVLNFQNSNFAKLKPVYKIAKVNTSQQQKLNQYFGIEFIFRS